MRAYFLTNMYMAGIHAGIQAQHCTAEMFTKYHEPSDKRNILFDWAKNHKTTVIVNGGMNYQMQEAVKILSEPNNKFPWACFHESHDAANGLLTSIGIVIPSDIYSVQINQTMFVPKAAESFLADIHKDIEYTNKLKYLIQNAKLMR